MSAAGKSRTTVTAAEVRAEIVADIEQQGRAITKEMKAATQRIQQAEAEHDVELDQWRQEAAAARRDHVVEPERPEPPLTQQDRNLLLRLQHERDGLQQTENDALRDHAERVEAAWQDARAELAEQAEEALKALQPVLDSSQEWLRLLSEVRSALDFTSNKRAVNGRASRTPRRVELQHMLDLANGADPLEPAALPQQRESYGPGASEEDIFHRPRQLGYKPVKPLRDSL